MDQFTHSGKGYNSGQYKLPSHESRPVPTPAANVVGSQQRTMDPTVSVHDRRLPPAPPSYGPSTSTSSQTYAAPVGPPLETSRQSGPSSIGRAPAYPVAVTTRSSTGNHGPASHHSGNHAVSQVPQNATRPSRLSTSSWGPSIHPPQMTTPITSNSTNLGMHSPLPQYGVQAQSSMSSATTSASTRGSSSYPSGGFSPDSSDESSPSFVMTTPPADAGSNHLTDSDIHSQYRNVHLQAKLKDPANQPPDSAVEVRREKRVVLELFLCSTDRSIDEWGWQGIQLPPTGSVKSAQPRLQEGLLFLSVLAYGSSTGALLSRPCDNCWTREWRALGHRPSTQPYIVDFKADNPITILSRTSDSPFLKAEVTFHFTCYTNHQKEEYELVVELRDKYHLLVAHHRLPYQFNSVIKRKIPKSSNELPSQPMPGQQTRSHPMQDLQSGPSFPTPSAVPGPEHHSREYSAPPQRAHPVYMRQYAPHDTNHSSVILERLAPSEGPVLGGLTILLSGVNFPSPPECIYAKFGSLVTPTFWHNPYTLECPLPSSPHPGLVKVSLSLYQHPEGPDLGQSNCWFRYTSDRECICAFLRAMSTQDGSTPFESLDHFLPPQPPNFSPDNYAMIHHMAQSQSHFAPISANEMENLAFRFLMSLVGSPSWRDTISYVNDHHQTLAHLAVLFRYTALLEKLVEWGVDLDVQDLNGFTALHCAYLCKDWECVRILRCAGADEVLEDNLGRLPVDIYSPRTGYTRASTPSSGGTSSPARISSEGEEDWENVPRDTLHPSGLEVPRVVKDQPASEAHTSDSHSGGKPSVISVSSPSSGDSNDSWVKKFDEKVRIINSPINPTSTFPSQSRQVAQSSQLGQHTTPYPPSTSVSTRSFYLHEPTREQATAHHPSPGTPASDLTSSLPLSDAGPPFSRAMSQRGESSSDLSSVYPPSHSISPMSTPSPMPPSTPLQSSWSYYLSLQMHRPDSSASCHQNMPHARSEARVQQLRRPSRSPCRTGIRYDPPPYPPPVWSRFGAITPYLDEKAQKETVDERRIFMGSSHLSPSPSPPPVHESEHARMKHLKVEKNNKESKGDIRAAETTKGKASWMKEKERLGHRFAEHTLTPIDAHSQAEHQINLQQRGRHYHTQHGDS